MVFVVLVAQSCPTLLQPPWTVALQAPLSMGFPKQVYWSGLPFPSPGDLPNSGIEPESPALTGGFFTTEPPGSPEAWLGKHKECVLKFRGRCVIICILER